MGCWGTCRDQRYTGPGGDRKEVRRRDGGQTYGWMWVENTKLSR